jgi:hypothetical protein
MRARERAESRESTAAQRAQWAGGEMKDDGVEEKERNGACVLSTSRRRRGRAAPRRRGDGVRFPRTIILIPQAASASFSSPIRLLPPPLAALLASLPPGEEKSRELCQRANKCPRSPSTSAPCRPSLSRSSRAARRRTGSPERGLSGARKRARERKAPPGTKASRRSADSAPWKDSGRCVCFFRPLVACSNATHALRSRSHTMRAAVL